MAIKADFDVPIDGMVFTTRKNGDEIVIKKIHLGPTEAAHLAELINSAAVLNVVVKEK